MVKTFVVIRGQEEGEKWKRGEIFFFYFGGWLKMGLDGC